jgi:hypothetical protein
MCHNHTVSPRVALVLLWIEYRIARLRRRVERSSKIRSSWRQGTAEERDLFDRRDLRARW